MEVKTLDWYGMTQVYIVLPQVNCMVMYVIWLMTSGFIAFAERGGQPHADK